MSVVLVTGGAGYIGSHCVQALKARGFDVVVYDNLATGFRESLPKDVKFIFGDVRDTDLLGRVMKDQKVDSVIHFAAALLVGESVQKPLDYYENNFGGTLSVVKACETAGVSKLVFSSTAAVYGNPLSPAAANIAEDHACFPVSPYGSSKYFSEQLIQDVAKKGQIRTAILRYFNVAGAAADLSNGQRVKNATHLVKVCCEVALGVRDEVQVFGDQYPTPDGTGIRDYIHIEDLVTAHLLALEYLADGGSTEIFNCGYGKGYSVLEVIEAMSKVLGRQIKYRIAGPRGGDIAEVVANTAKIRRVLGFEPRFNSIDLICEHALAWERKMQGL